MTSKGRWLNREYARHPSHGNKTKPQRFCIWKPLPFMLHQRAPNGTQRSTRRAVPKARVRRRGFHPLEGLAPYIILRLRRGLFRGRAGPWTCQGHRQRHVEESTGGGGRACCPPPPPPPPPPPLPPPPPPLLNPPQGQRLVLVCLLLLLLLVLLPLLLLCLLLLIIPPFCSLCLGILFPSFSVRPSLFRFPFSLGDLFLSRRLVIAFPVLVRKALGTLLFAFIEGRPWAPRGGSAQAGKAICTWEPSGSHGQMVFRA